MSLWNSFVNWCKGMPSPGYTEEAILKTASELKVDENKWHLKTGYIDYCDPLGQMDSLWFGDVKAAALWPSGECRIEPGIKVRYEEDKPLNYNKVIDEIEEFGGWADRTVDDFPDYGLMMPTDIAPPLEPRRKPAKAKVPKKAPTPPKKGKNAPKARTARKKTTKRTPL